MSDIVHRSDIVVFDHGLHWPSKDPEDYRRAMANMFRAFETKSLKLVAWRETSAQHYNTTYGDWIWGIPNLMEQGCVPIRLPSAGFRLPAMTEAAHDEGFVVRNAADASFASQPIEAKEMVFLPFFNYTFHLHYLHPKECAHFCSTPYLWLPIWRSLRLAIDRIIDNR